MLRLVIILFLGAQFATYAQEKESNTLIPKVIVGADSNTIFETKKGVHEANQDYAILKIGAYVSAYYAYYDDETVNNGYVQIPTMAARNKELGLNMAQMSMKYTAKNLRGNLGLHFGDIPSTVWPQQYNMIQEANAGVKLFKKLWLDAGFFKSHVGVESTEPRENITSSMALADNFEPYFFAGAKLTYEFNEKLLVQLNTFNSYASFVDNNKNKLVGLSIVYNPNEKWSFTYNFLNGTESPDSITKKQMRNYNNFYFTYTHKKWILALEGNYGWQTNSLLVDSSKSAIVYSGLIVARYQVLQSTGLYARQEFLSDENRILTGDVDFGKSVYGTTFGLEYKPIKNAALNLQWRNLNCEKLIFKQGNKIVNQRNEFIICLDVWF
ncbi:MAG: outer membrane beta-barrel protein [Sphingobacteriaceae bacterium]|nr:outer membrane beta-barrel protein [Sphingobacteriaceae bacterium]